MEMRGAHRKPPIPEGDLIWKAGRFALRIVNARLVGEASQARPGTGQGDLANRTQPRWSWRDERTRGQRPHRRRAANNRADRA